MGGLRVSAVCELEKLHCFGVLVLSLDTLVTWGTASPFPTQLRDSEVGLVSLWW